MPVNKPSKAKEAETAAKEERLAKWWKTRVDKTLREIFTEGTYWWSGRSTFQKRLLRYMQSSALVQFEGDLVSLTASGRARLKQTRPTKAEVTDAKREIAEEDERAEAAARLRRASAAVVEAENERRAKLPSEHPDHICGVRCDGQDGMNSRCARLRVKLFG